MFKVGDKVVCIDDSPIHSVDKLLVHSCLTLNKTYEVKDIVDGRYLYLSNDCGATRTYAFSRFRPLTECRQEKIKKICSNLET
jgi:hypothetical protein